MLILALIGLIVAETMLERASVAGLSAGQHRLFAWLDLAICSVFLFEFALKLTLAPHRFTYFLRHMAIDFVASLPFGFLAIPSIWLKWRPPLGRGHNPTRSSDSSRSAALHV